MRVRLVSFPRQVAKRISDPGAIAWVFMWVILAEKEYAL